MYLLKFKNMLSTAEENYLKALLKLSIENNDVEISSSDIARVLDVKPTSVNNMLKRLKLKEYIDFERYGKAKLTIEGRQIAVNILRKHRLWETFLYTTLDFSWDEIHEIAEQLEHIHSEKLVDKLDAFLGFPAFDPHGEIIPGKNGKLPADNRLTIAGTIADELYKIVGVKDNSKDFLQYLMKIKLELNTEILIIERESFDGSIRIKYDDKIINISQKVSENIFVQKK